MRKTSVTVRGLVGLSLGIALALNAPLAAAKAKKADSSAKSAEKKKVLVGGFEGPKSDQARKAVIAALKDDGSYDVSDSASVKPGGDDKSYASASGGAAAVIVGSVKKGSGLVVSVHNGGDGSLVQDVEIKGETSAKLEKSIDSTLAVSVADAISQAKAGGGDSDAAADDDKPGKADEDEKKDDKKKDEDDKPAADAADSADTGPSPLDIMAGLRAVHRSFSYHDSPSQLFPNQGYPALLTYQLPLGPAVFIDGTVYPLAFAGRGPAADIGITGGYQLNIATKSVYDNGTTQQQLTTSASEFFVGLRGRIPLDAHEFGLVAAYGQQDFTLKGDENNPLVPDVTYKFIKLGADMKLRFDELTIGAHLGTRLVSDTGELQSRWFPHTKTQSIEAGLLLGYAATRQLDIVAGLDLVRYAFNFNPIPDGTNANTAPVAGGAVDQYVSGWLGVRYRLPNSSH
jgi:hypothetical protein